MERAGFVLTSSFRGDNVHVEWYGSNVRQGYFVGDKASFSSGQPQTASVKSQSVYSQIHDLDCDAVWRDIRTVV